MRRVLRWTLGSPPLFVALLALVACQGSPPVSTTTPRSAESPRPSPRPSGEEAPPRVTPPASVRGISIDLSLTGVALTDRQRDAIAKTYGALEQATAPVRVEESRLAAALADELTANGFDTEAADAQLGRVVHAAVAARPAVEQRIDELHAVLGASQREMVRGSFSTRWAGGGPGATSAATYHGGLSLSVVAAELGLDAARRDAAREALERAQRTYATPEDHTRHRKIMDAFRSETFDAAKLGVGDEFVRGVKASSEQTVELVAVLSPHLRPDERVRLAQLLRGQAAP